MSSSARLFRLAHQTNHDILPVTWWQRFGVVRRRNVLPTLFIPLLWGTGAYTIYIYLAVYLAAVIGWGSSPVSAVLFLWGVSAALGLLLGGRSTDWWGFRPVIMVSLCVLAVSFGAFSLWAGLLSPAAARIPALVSTVVWGISAWSFFPAQQAHLIEAAGIEYAPIVLSLNASFMFLGFSLGAVVGSVTPALGTARNLGWVGAAWVVAALLLAVAIARSATQQMPFLTTHDASLGSLPP